VTRHINISCYSVEPAHAVGEISPRVSCSCLQTKVFGALPVAASSVVGGFSGGYRLRCVLDALTVVHNPSPLKNGFDVALGVVAHRHGFTARRSAEVRLQCRASAHASGEAHEDMKTRRHGIAYARRTRRTCGIANGGAMSVPRNVA
jgi:hypothetical protein